MVMHIPILLLTALHQCNKAWCTRSWQQLSHGQGRITSCVEVFRRTWIEGGHTGHRQTQSD